jgi:hypothetical protein
VPTAARPLPRLPRPIDGRLPGLYLADVTGQTILVRTPSGALIPHVVVAQAPGPAGTLTLTVRPKT